MNLKSATKLLLQKTLGFENYLFVFSLFTHYRLQNNKHEKEFLRFLDMIPNERSIILDIGANIGVTAVAMAKRAPKATVHAFEPIPENFRVLTRVAKHFKLKNIVLHNNALGEEAGRLKMVLPIIDGVKMQGLSHIHNENEESPSNQGAITLVDVKKLDELPFLSNGETLSAVKIDVENFEYHVLKGAARLLTNQKPVIYCELWDNENKKKTLELVEGWGYAVKVEDNDKLVDYKNQSVTNYFFINKK